MRRLGTAGSRIHIIKHRRCIRHFHEMTVAHTTHWLDNHAVPEVPASRARWLGPLPAEDHGQVRPPTENEEYAHCDTEECRHDR